jgi:ElaB/YqjD/DUF883 family membrane-anchored ribosome-binding protein
MAAILPHPVCFDDAGFDAPLAADYASYVRRRTTMAETNEGTGPEQAAGDGGDTSSRFGRAKEFVNEKYDAASDAMRDQYNRMREKVDDVDFGAVSDQVRSYVRSNPGKALLISVGVGFLIGLLLRRDDDEE